MSIAWWDRWIGNLDGEPVYFQKRLASWTWRGNLWTLRLHKFVKADNPMCFHSHPAHAYRLILWGGYVEQVMFTVLTYKQDFRRWLPGMFGYVAPDYVHRIDRLHGKASYSLWVHGPKVASIELHGSGWPDELLHRAGKDRIRVKTEGTAAGSGNG